MKFTGKQITLMVVAVSAATILTPAAVNAATGSSVNITDPVYAANKARVTGGKLYVGDGYGPMTVDGLVRVSDGTGALTVDGTVSAVPKDAATTWSANGTIDNGGSTQLLLRDLTTAAGISINSIALSHITGTGPVEVVLHAFKPTTAGNCAGGGTNRGYFGTYAVPQDDTRTLSFSPGFRVARVAGEETCVHMFIIAGSPLQEVDVTATGTTY